MKKGSHEKTAFSLKTVFAMVCCAVFALGLATQAQASLVWDDINDSSDVYINNDYDAPDNNNWYQLDLPDWYNSNLVTAFTIDMYGSKDDSSRPIDIWKRFASQQLKVVGYNVNNSGNSFILRLDLIQNALLYNYYRKTNGSSAIPGGA